VVLSRNGGGGGHLDSARLFDRLHFLRLGRVCRLAEELVVGDPQPEVIVVSYGASGELGTEADGGGWVIKEEGVGATAGIVGFTAIYIGEFDGFGVCAGNGGPEEGSFAIRHCHHLVGRAGGCPTEG
jgi:hypothetical protein